MFHGVRAIAVAAGILLAALEIGAPALAQPPAGLTVFAAGTLAGPFRALDTAFQQQYPNVAVRPIFAGSVALARRIADLHQRTDIFATADFRVIPKYLFGAGGKERYADWYAGFARNAITFTYTDQSKSARQITP